MHMHHTYHTHTHHAHTHTHTMHMHMHTIHTNNVYDSQGSKFVVSLIAMLISGQTTEALKGWTFAGSVKAAGAPAVVYAFQNIMIQTAYANMDGLTFNLMNQTKILQVECARAPLYTHTLSLSLSKNLFTI